MGHSNINLVLGYYSFQEPRKKQICNFYKDLFNEILSCAQSEGKVIFLSPIGSVYTDENYNSL